MTLLRTIGITFLAVLLAACSAPRLPGATSAAVASGTPAPAFSSQPLLVVAAADLQFALPEIAAAFEQEGGIKPTITLGSTGNLAAQIEHGAPADLFFAADKSFIARLADKGLVGFRQLYATGRIVLTASTAASVAVTTLADLTRPEVKKIAIANPEHAPYGRAAKQALEASGLWAQVQPKLVLGENIAQTFQFVQTGNADAGIVALSVVRGVAATPYTLIDDRLHAPLEQEVAVIATSKQPERAKQFLEFVNGPHGRPIMKKFGFVLPGE